MSRVNTRISLAVASIVLTPFISGTIFAQRASASTASAVGGEDDLALEEIVITAQRREESSQHAAIAISTLGGDAVTEASITRPGGLGTIVPSLQVQDATGPYSLFYVRGVGNFAANGLSDAALAFNFDGVSVARSGTSGFFYDLERVEVLKGPQGTLYGRNATGGAINVISKKPALGEFAASAAVDAGNYSSIRAEGMVNLPMGESAALRVAAFHTKHDGYMNDGSDDQNDTGARLSLLIAPTQSLSVSFVGDYFKQGGIQSGATVIGVTNPAAATAPSFGLDDRVGLFSSQTSAYLATQTNSLSRRSFAPFDNIGNNNNRFWGASVSLDWTTPIGTLTVIPAYRDSRPDYASFATGVLIREQSHDKQTTFEARLASPTDQALRYVVGGFYLHDPNSVSHFDVNQQSIATFQSYTAKTDSQAVFANLTYAIVPTLRATGGIRYTKDKKDFYGSTVSDSFICPYVDSVTFAFLPACTPGSSFPSTLVWPYNMTTPYSATSPYFQVVPTATTAAFLSQALTPSANAQSYSRVTWRVGTDWDITDQNMLYASYETGYKSGGFFFSHDTNFYKPETIHAYTLGSKNRFFDSRLQANLELFYWKYYDQQISHLSRDSAGTLIFPTENVGLATIKGAELDVQFKAFRDTLLSADAQYNQAAYDNFVYTTPNQNNGAFNGTACQGPNSSVSSTQYTVDCSGKTPPYAPKWSVSGGVQQTVPLGENKLVGNARAHYQSKTLTGLEFLPVEYQGGYTTWDFDLTFSTANDKFSVGAYVNNAFDKTVLVYSFPTPLSGFATGILNHPRTFGGRVTARF